jgi:hypothetical protein
MWAGGYAQYCERVEEHRQKWDDGAYFWGGSYSTDHQYIHFGHSFFAHYLLDSDFNMVDSITAKDVTGCYSRLTYNGKYFITKASGMMNEIDTVEIRNLRDGAVTIFTCEASSHFIPYASSDRLIVGQRGRFQQVDLRTGSVQPFKKTITSGALAEYWPRGMFLNNDEDLVLSSGNGVEVVSTKKWKTKMVLETGKNYTNLYPTQDRKHYYYSQDGVITVRRSEDHNLVHQFDAKTRFIMSVKVAADMSYMLYIDKLRNVYYYDFETRVATKIIASGNYTECIGLILDPGLEHFYVGVNANRWVKFKLYRSGEAENIDQLIPVFEYSEEVAEQSESNQLKLELALKKNGYDIPLDNMSNDADEGLYELFCKEHGFENIKTDEARKFLGLAPLE